MPNTKSTNDPVPADPPTWVVPASIWLVVVILVFLVGMGIAFTYHYFWLGLGLAVVTIAIFLAWLFVVSWAIG